MRCGGDRVVKGMGRQEMRENEVVDINKRARKSRASGKINSQDHQRRASQ